MDNISKFLKKLSSKELEKILSVLEKIKADDLSDFNLKKIKGHESLFRIKIGKIRIVFQRGDEGNSVVDINYRKDVYKKL